MAVRKGKVVAKRLFVEVDGRKHPVPEACALIKGSQFEALAGREVEVLMAQRTILAIRAIEEIPELKYPIITCYLVGPDIVFDPDIFRQVEPFFTKALVESGHLSERAAKELNEFTAYG